MRRSAPPVDTSSLQAAAGSLVVGLSAGGRREIRATAGLSGASVFRIASLTKPVTALALFRVADQAQVPLGTPVVEVLPALAAGWNADRGITITHVLSQTSGLTSTVDADAVAALGQGDDALLKAARLVVAAGSRRSPGRRWEYYNGNYFLAGALIAALHGSSYEQAVTDLVLSPAGMTDTSFLPPPDLVLGHQEGRELPRQPYPRGRRPSGGLCSSVDDLLAFTEDLRADTHLLTQVATAQTARDDDLRYGLGWAIGPSQQLFLNGRLPGYRAAMLLLPAHALAGVALTNDNSALPAAAAALSDAQRDLTGDDLTEAINRFAA